MKSAKQIVDDCNALARAFYKSRGYDTPEGYEFHKATHPDEQSCWNLAVIAYDHIEGTDVDDALTEIEEIITQEPSPGSGW